jgi:hypothetical protein
MALMTAGSSIPSMPMLTRGSAPEVLMSDNREILPPLAPQSALARAGSS